MKLKTDFTTNSSSSSFVVFGMWLDDFLTEEEQEELLEEFDGLSNYLEQRFQNTNLGFNVFSDEYDAKNTAIGIDMPTFLVKYPDAKISDIKKIVAREINGVFNTNLTEKDITYIEESYWV